MDMWSSDISDISSHKSIDISCPNDDSSILTGVPLWSDMWVNSAPVTSEVKECLPVDDVATEEVLDDDQVVVDIFSLVSTKSRSTKILLYSCLCLDFW
jgi:hypothetical protein